MNPVEIRTIIEEYLEKLNNSKKIIRRVRGFGHQAGIPIENWVHEKLNECLNGLNTYKVEDFIHKVFQSFSPSEDLLEDIWWGFRGDDNKRLLITKRQIENIQQGIKPGEWQQAGADLVIYSGEQNNNLNDIIAINVKSHNISRKSRDPNIMSAQRLLYFLKGVLERKFRLDDINLWFMGISYSPKGSNAIVKAVNVKDLFLLDLDKLPIINFDAAIQIQWHVHNMIEKGQTKIEFIDNLAKTFMRQWKLHAGGKTEHYTALVDSIRSAIQSRTD